MTKFQTKLTTAFATGAVLLNALAPLALADTSLTISGNGTGSSSDATATSTNVNTLTQTNNTAITNNVSVDANTGHNNANGNTGGNVDVTTGRAATDVTIDNAAGSNTATVDSCNCSNNADVLISGNGSHTDNTANLTNTNTTALYQTNNTAVTNDVDVTANTGKNRANDNTGGDVSVTTGRADTIVDLSTRAGVNVARVGGTTGAGTNAGGTVTARILGNGTDSANSINLASVNDVLLEQANNTDITNDVSVDANTGHNRANDNTGGNVDVTTGRALTDVYVDNMAGFNAANIDSCGCLSDLTAKISGNGSHSDNDLTWAGVNVLSGFQTNNTALDNNLSDLDSDTGYNHANDNTGAVSFANDPSLTTGVAGTSVDVTNTGSANTFGQDLTGLLHHVDFSMDFGGLLSFFMAH